MGVRPGGAILTISGAVTVVLSVTLALILFILAAAPLLLGAFQMRVGLAALIREQWTGKQLLAAALGGIVGVLHLPGSMFNPDGNGPRTALGVALIAANVAAGIWVRAPVDPAREADPIPDA
jgi:uncharacterized protein YbjT (DUF2867 family)